MQTAVFSANYPLVFVLGKIQPELKGRVRELIYVVKYQISAGPEGP